MPVTQDRDVSSSAAVARETISLHRASVAASQADVLQVGFRPGYAFEIVSIQHFASSATATATYSVKIGAASALSVAATPVANTRGDAALGAGVLGSAADSINLHATTNATGALGNLSVLITIRPQGLRR